MDKVRTRFAPSPTGFLHIGSLRTALYAYALAKHNNGDFILRIEDTDQKRRVEGSVEAVKGVMTKFGLIWDEFYVQSERKNEGIYEKAAKKLVASGHAFYCKCEPRKSQGSGFSTVLRDPCRDKNYTDGAVRLRVPDGKIVSYTDFVHKKEISWNTDSVYDATLLKSDGFPTYHLAVCVDDLGMKISHVLRGHDWLPSTPIHLLVYEYLGEGRPEIGHLTDILSGETGKKLSKRRDSVFVEQFIEEGYLPEALLNFVMLLGWAPKDNRELYTLDEFVKAFDINGFQDANPRFFRDKLDWFNGHYIRQKDDSVLKALFKPYLSEKEDEKQLVKIVPLIKDRIKKLSDIKSFAGFFFHGPKVDTKSLGDNYKDHINEAIKAVEDVESWKIDELNSKLAKLIEDKGFKTGDFYMDLRVAITGSKFTPPINESIIILGKKLTLERLKSVLK